jgi:hypothetical protein
VSRLPQDFGAGLLLLVIAAIALWSSADLSMGTPRAMGPGMVPRVIAVLVAIAGVGLIAAAWLVPGSRLEAWSLRGPIFVLGAIVVFAMTVRTLGLAVAGPLAVFIGAFASPEARVKETAIFAVVLTAACILLFKVFLGLPIPVATFL